MEISFPTLVGCVFAAYLYGGPNLADHRYEPLPNPSAECHFSAWIEGGTFHIEQKGQEVFIPLPLLTGWYRFQYYWGEDQAYLSVPGATTWYQIPVRVGSSEYY